MATSTQQLVLQSQRSDQKPRRRGAGLKVPYSHTRFGCRTCKARKIRCDETHPKCQNCTRTGRTCEGMPQPAGSLQFTPPVTLAHFYPAKNRKLRQDEVSFLDVFRHRLIDGIVGDADSPAWRCLILQAVHEQPALCHAAVAFGALYDQPNASYAGALTPSKQLALKHYNECIKGLQDAISSHDGGSPNVILLCIMLCICFELRMKNPNLSQSHLEHGLRILQAHAAKVDNDLALTFAKMDIQSSVFLGHRAPVLDIKRWANTTVGDGVGYLQAHKDLTCLLSPIIGFLQSKAAVYRYRHMEPPPIYLYAEAQGLRDKLEAFRERHMPNFPRETAEIIKKQPLQRILWLKYLMARILLATCLDMEEMAYDALVPDFDQIVTIAESLLLGKPPKATKPEQNEFSLNMGIIFPLFRAAQKCRAPSVRRRAIKLLSIITRSEGPWEAVACQKYAERAMALEEEGLNLDPDNLDGIQASIIPEWRRIHLLGIQPQNDERYATVTFCSRPNGLDGEWDDLVEMVKW